MSDFEKLLELYTKYIEAESLGKEFIIQKEIQLELDKIRFAGYEAAQKRFLEIMDEKEIEQKQ